MDFLPPEIDQYSAEHTKSEPAYLKELERETYLKVLMPRMLSGHMQGRILSMITALHQPKRILEIGTYTGYSALCMAEGLANGGVLESIDINEELEPLVRKYVKIAGMEDRIQLHYGNALEVIPALTGEFDMVFIDADKINYSNYYNMIIDRVRKGGLIIADNVLWSGKVTEKKEKFDKDTQALLDFNKMVTDDIRVENVLLPVRDGLMMMRKL